MRRVFVGNTGWIAFDLFVTKWKSTLHLAEKLLHDPRRTQFVPVSIAGPLSVCETVALFRELQGRKMRYPNWS